MTLSLSRGNINYTIKGNEGMVKVIILNGSPKAKGNTATALREAEHILQEQGIDTEWIHVGHLQIAGCSLL